MLNTSPSARDTLERSAGPIAIVIANALLIGAAFMLMRAHGNTARPILLIVAALSASVGLAWTVRVPQRDNRRAALLLCAGLFCVLAGLMIPPFPAEVMAVLAIAFVAIAVFPSLRALRT